ncbi:MAG: ADP-forming succinate--CoA ligase subunit beta [Deltaproteobacteria bacterium]|nr:ADP-forming succinate--CoA ligase subunit beta [Deltaproteobacteria bacterium]
MKIHEYQAKSLLAKHGMAIPRGEMAFNPEDIALAAEKLGGQTWVVKAQIHAGGRGKAGGVKVCKTKDALEKEGRNILGMTLVSPQTGPQGRVVKKVLVEEGLDIKKELYFSMLVDRSNKSLVALASTEGGMEIEEVAANHPDKIIREEADPVLGFRPFQGARLAYRLGLDKIDPKLVRAMSGLLLSAYRVFTEEDASMIEINPLVITKNNQLLALDAKITLDDNALFRHPDNVAFRDLDEEETLEVEAADAGLNYIRLEGNIGCMVNGAGLAMATMDMIQAHGGKPANFLDVGGTADQKRVETAFRIITKDPNVKCILINIFGGIVRCDLVAEGVVAAFKNLHMGIPVVVRLEGTNADKALTIIQQAGLSGKLIQAQGLKEAAEKSVHAASGQ